MATGLKLVINFMIISLHLPKAAASGFLSSLESCYGNKLQLDYSDSPINTSSAKRKSNALTMCLINGVKSQSKKTYTRTFHYFLIGLRE